jgi:predicted anti-sigma-YlaC factor YlaD
MMDFQIQRLCVAAVALALSGGCSIKRIAVNKIGNALASGGSTYESDDDLQLVGDALPFGLKMMESLLAESPHHRGLLQAACQGFTTYSYLYVQQESERIADQDMASAAALNARARRLFLRGHRYGYQALAAGRPGFNEEMTANPGAALLRIKRRADAPLLYWNAAALGMAISVSKNDAAMLARLPEVEALIDRALELDETWSDGALHEVQVLLAAAKPGAPNFDRIETHFRRALELSKGKRASLFVAYAESVSVPKQNSESFRSALEKALAIDPDQYPAIRLPNLAAQRRAQWLMDRMDDLILPLAAEEKQEEKQ